MSLILDFSIIESFFLDKSYEKFVQKLFLRLIREMTRSNQNSPNKSCILFFPNVSVVEVIVKHKVYFRDKSCSFAFHKKCPHLDRNIRLNLDYTKVVYVS